MTETLGPTRLEVAETDGRIVAKTPAIRLTVSLDPFAFEIANADGTPIMAPPPGSGERLRSDPDPDSDPAAAPAHSEDPALAPASRYLGLTYGVDGMLVGSYVSSGRAPRWYAVTAVERWERDGATLRLEGGTNDVVGRTARVSFEFLDDATVRLRLTLDRDVGVVEMGLAAAATADEGFFGLGERFTRANHRGHEVLNWAEDSCFDPRPGHDWTYWPVPFFLSNRGYGVFLDTTRRAVFRLASDRPDAWQASVDGTELDAVVFAGPDPLAVVQRFTALTGRPPLPAPWAFGVWKTTLSGEAAVRAEAQRLRDEELGVSVVWVYDYLDLDNNSGWNSAMGYPEGEYPDLPGLVDELHDGGFKVLAYVNQYFIVGRPRTDEGIAKGYFVKRPDGAPYLVPGPDPNPEVGIRYGSIALYDPTHPEGRPWWQAMLRRLLLETSFDGWMHDFGEYTPRDAVFADGRSGEEIRNLYPTLYHQTAAEACRDAKPDFAFFVRSGYTGANAWAPLAWPGDQHTDWSTDRGLPSIVPAALSVGICGANAWGPDIGGFFDAYDGSDIARSEELWIRWCQFGALTPVMRDHLGPKRMTTPGAVDLWSSAETIDTWRRYARLHNALVPYLYAYSAIAHQTGIPTMRHMVLRYPDQPEALCQDHQYLLGDELLVAPVVEPGVTTRRVWFPPGQWIDFWSDAVHTGPGYAEVPAPIEQIPLFVRGGAILPLLATPVVTLAGVRPEDLLTDLELRLYPDGGGAAAPGAAAFTFHDGSAVRLREDGDRLTLDFAGAARGRQTTVRLPAAFAVADVVVDDRRLPAGIGGAGPPTVVLGADGGDRIRVPEGVGGLSIRLAPR